MPPFSPLGSATTVGGNLVASSSQSSAAAAAAAWTLRRPMMASSTAIAYPRQTAVHHAGTTTATTATAAAAQNAAFVVATDDDVSSSRGCVGGMNRRASALVALFPPGMALHRFGRGGDVSSWSGGGPASASHHRPPSAIARHPPPSSSPRGGGRISMMSSSSAPSEDASPSAVGGGGGGGSTLSSRRARAAIDLLPSYLVDARSVERYSAETCPHGALQLGVAESRLCEMPVDGLVDIVEVGGGGGGRKADDGGSDVPSSGGMKLTDVLGRLASSDVAHRALSPSGTTTTRTDVFEREMVYYQPTHGTPSARRAMAGYLQRLLLPSSPPSSSSFALSSSSSTSTTPAIAAFDPENVILGAGCNAVLENLVMCLADPGDAVLIPTPYYAAFEFDLAARAGCVIVPTYGSRSKGRGAGPIPPEFYYPCASSLDDAYDRASSRTGRPPRVLLISHPNNPLGVCYPPSVVRECMDWCRARGVHLISDEIYAGSVYREERAGGTGEEEENDSAGGRPTFVSAMALGGDSNSYLADGRSAGIGLGPYVHLVYALSKDFALSGLRVGVAYTENEEILLPLQKLNDLCQISSQTQLLVERMILADAVVAIDDGSGGKVYDATRKFTDVYLSSNRNNVRARCDELQSCLNEIDVLYLPADSGLFVWMDMREFLPALPDGVTEDSESDESKDRRERRLYLSLMKDYGLLFTPGMSMRNERAGFFRFVFTAASEEEFELGLTRLRTFVRDMRTK
jgi:aspartate/methionine/tyrosine aminotransferase